MTRPATFRFYSRNVLLALIIGYVVNLLLVIVPAALLAGIDASGNIHNWLNALLNTGILLFIAQAIFVLIYDWRGAVTLRGWGKSRILRENLMANFELLYVILYLFFPEIMLPIYLFRVVWGWRQAEEQRRLAMRKQIALMEVQLGISPPTSGTCRACHKPLQVGAEFCQYCGVPVIERLKICPSCAATTLPDAKWCPQCGIRLAA